MNPNPIFKLFSSKGQTQALIYKGVSSLLISAAMLSLVVLTDYGRIVRASGPETGEQLNIEMLHNIDSADRKFFSPGYGALSSGIAKVEVLLPTDPADRKFFTPGYGVNIPSSELAAYHQSEWSRTPNTYVSIADLRQIEPADRKFFNPGYGTQTFTEK